MLKRVRVRCAFAAGRRTLAALAAVFALAALGCGPARAAPPENARFDQLGMEAGLGGSNVVAMLQDADGFMWFGGQGGLSRFDGYRVLVYKHDSADPGSVADDNVKALHRDARGRMWVGTRAGLQLYNPINDSFKTIPPARPHGEDDYLDVRAIASDAHGVLWMTARRGMLRYDPASGKSAFMQHDAADPGSLCDDLVNAFVFDRAGNLWIGTDGGLDRLAPGASRFEHLRVDDARAPDPKLNAVAALAIDRDGVLWVGTKSALETWRVDGAAPYQRHRFGAAERFGADGAVALHQDRDGGMWVGTGSKGLKLWERGASAFASYRHDAGNPRSIVNDAVSSVYQDRAGVLWVGTYYGGVSRIDLSTEGIKHIIKGESGAAFSLSSNNIAHVLGDGKGKLWLATTANGVDQIDLASGAVVNYHHVAGDAHSLSENQTTALWYDGVDQLWVGTRSGLNRLDLTSGRFTLHQFDDGNPPANYIQSIMPDREGNLWIGSRNGLHRLVRRSGAVRSYHYDSANPDGVADTYVWTTLEDRRGRLWVGTSNGLDLLDRSSGRFTHARHNPRDPESISHNRIAYLHEDSAGTLWVGTESGLNRMSSSGAPARFRQYLVRDGLPDGAIDAILEDEAHHLWVASDGGISDFNPRAGTFRNYGSHDGAAEGGFFVGSAYKAPDGTMYFGAFNEGVNWFRPGSVHGNLQAPQVRITDFQILNSSVRHGGPRDGFAIDGPIQSASALTLSYRHSVLSFEFSALDYADPGRNEYAYQLEGFDKDWIRTDASKRFVTYTNLDPGHYVFRVRASNNTGVWNDAGAVLAVTISAPYWRALWFRLLVGGTLLAATVLAFRLRVRALTTQKLVLESEVRKRTGELVQQKEVAERERANVELAHNDIALLSDIGREITAMLNQETIMMTLYRRLHVLMSADLFAVGVYREEAGELDFPFVMEKGQHGKLVVRSVAERDELALWCVGRRKPVFINDWQIEHQRYIGNDGDLLAGVDPVADAPARPTMHAMLYVPLTVMGQMYGVLTVQSEQRNAYQPVHVDMLATLASYAGVALDNADAYQKLGRVVKELKKTQQQLVFQEKMASIGALTAGIAHEINNPANFAHAGAQNLASEIERFRAFLLQLAGEDADAAVVARLNHDIDALVAKLGIIVEGTSRIRDLVKDLRSFSRLDEAERKTVSITDSLTATARLVRTMYEDTAEFRYEFEAHPVIECWPAQLNQVFMNLIVNACDAIREKPWHDPAAPRGTLTIAVREEDGFVVIEFDDDGCGIAPAMIDHIFEPFVTTKGPDKGTGLGLSISFSIIGWHKGTLSVSSVPGEGSCFTVRLPITTWS
ncbi:MAG: two-component regulator propeller domain-containing protein [Pseudomonadota bacterium]